MTARKDIYTYPAIYFKFFEEAAKRQIRVPFPSRKEATATRHRFHNFRARLRKENHPLVESANKVEILLEETTLIFQPSGFGLIDALQKAGIPIKSLEEDIDFEALDQRLLEIAQKKKD